MRIAIETLGTRGDVQPFVALALRLVSAGHEVRIAAPSQFESMVAEHGIGFAHLPGEFLELMERPEAKRAMAGGRGFGAGFKMLKHFRPIIGRLLDASWAAARAFDPDILIYHPKSMGVPHIGERLNRPTVLASPLPGFTPTAAFPSPLLPFASLGPLNRMSHRLAAGSANLLFGSLIRQWRRETLQLPARPARPLRPAATLYAYSRHLLPVPSDWGDDVLVSGYWFVDDRSNWRPDRRLQGFLEAGAPPVYVGFGSMPGLVPDQLGRLVLEALDRAGCRAVVATGGGALSIARSTDTVLVIDGAPHDRLFPLMAGCVHHGGAGTTAASLRAGRATAICPFFGDQPFWGRRIAQLGVGPEPIDIRDLTADRLAASMIAITRDGTMRARAEALGAAISAEDGVDRAVAFIEARLSGAAGPTAVPAPVRSAQWNRSPG